MLLGGHTLLKRAVDTLRGVPSLKDTSGRVTVTIVGERAELEGADRVIVDRYAGCGPLGGMETALGDLESSGDVEWAFFMPVDMPFLSFGPIEGLLREWVEACARGARVCHVIVEGRPQPLVSLMHRTVRPFMVQALTAGEFKVTPVLQSAGEVLASSYADRIGSGLHTTHGGQDTLAFPGAGWTVTGEQEQLKRVWFSNLNTEQDFLEAETFIAAMGSTR